MSSPRFLTGPTIQAEVARLMKSSAPAIAAVAFWGSKGGTQSGVSSRAAGQTQILCDLFSGACNPKEIQRLLDAGAEVRTLDGMHAKVWCVGDETIIGSANASCNGLGQETAKRATNVEAAFLLKDAALAESVRTWFSELWAGKEAIIVGTDEIADATLIWEENQSHPGRQTTRTVMGLLASKRAKTPLEHVRVLVYVDTNLSIEAQQAYEKVMTTYSDADLNLYGELIPVYEDSDGSWEISPGDIVIDYTCAPRGAKLKFGGIWRARTDLTFQPFKKRKTPKSRLVLLNQIFHIGGYRLPKHEQAELGRMIRAKMKKAGPDTFGGTYLDEPLSSLWANRPASAS